MAAPVVLWWVPGAGSGAQGQGAAVATDVRRLVAAAADEVDALAAAARGAAPQGGPGGQPAFWSGAGGLQRSLADLDGALAAGDARFFAFLDAAQRSLVALEVACRRAVQPGAAHGAAADGARLSPGSTDVARRMSSLAATMQRLNGTYGREAARAQLGGSLSAEQAQQLQRIARAARQWRAQVAAVAAAARQQGDTALQSELARLDALLQQLAAAQRLTLAAYLAAIQASNQALALWAGNAAYLEPGEQQVWQQADAGAADLTTAADTGFVFGADLSGGTAWAYGESAPGGDAGAAGGDAGAPGGDAGAAGGDAGAAADPGAGGQGAAAGSPDGWAGDGGEAAGGATPGDPGDPADPANSAAGGMAGLGAPGLAADASSSAPEGSAADGLASSPSPGTAGTLGRAGAADARWVVIHGGPDAGWTPEESPAAGVAPAFALQLGEAAGAARADDPFAPADPAAAAVDDDAAADGSEALDWEEICRPWQPDPGRQNLCAVPYLPPADAIDP